MLLYFKYLAYELFHRQNKLFTGFKIMQKALSNGAETMAKLSGISFAILFGEISPKIVLE